MTWWKRALLVTILWIAFFAGGGWYFTQIVLREKITSEQDRVISETLGTACGAGIAFIWVACAVFRKKRPGPNRDS